MSDSLGAASAEEQVLADRYELCELIGQGGMAEVHRAHDRLLDRRVAVKIFRRSGNSAVQRRFDDEARALARMAHPGLVAIFDVGTVDDRPFLVMEFVEGTTVQERLLAGPLPLGQVLRIGSVLADALAHAHHRGVVHRDVKPSNIMLDRDDLPHLTDFGIALVAGSPRLTSVNEVLGTPAYLAPEQLTDTEVGPPADVYALGLVLLECLSGELEYASGTSLEVALTRLNRPPRIPATLPPALIDLLAAMTATETFDRPTAEACAQRLRAALEDTGCAVVPPQRVSMSPPAGEPIVSCNDEDSSARVPIGPVAARRGLRWRLVAASVAGMAAVIAALVFLVSAPQPLTARPPAAADGSSHSGSSARTDTDRARAARDADTHDAGTPGSWARGSAPATGMLVANERSAAAVTPTAVPASSTPEPSQKSPSTSATPSATTPRQVTASTEPPTMASSEPPATTSTSTAQPSTSDAPSVVPNP